MADNTPQDVSKFATAVRAKYPEAYDSLDDLTLAKAVLAKYPQYAAVLPSLKPSASVLPSSVAPAAPVTSSTTPQELGLPSPQQQATGDLVKAIQPVDPVTGTPYTPTRTAPDDQTEANTQVNAPAPFSVAAGPGIMNKALRVAAFAGGLMSPAVPVAGAQAAGEAAEVAKNAETAAEATKGVPERMEQLRAADQVEAAQKATEAQATKEAQAQADQQASLVKNSKTVANLASKAANDGVMLDPMKGVRDYIGNLPSAEQDEFLEEVQPKITEILKKYNPKEGGLLDPRNALKFRQEVYDTFAADENLKPYAEDMHDALTDTLHSDMDGYRGFSTADNRLPYEADPLKASSKLGSTAKAVGKAAVSSADDVAKAAAQEAKTKSTPSVPASAPPPDPNSGSSFPAIERDATPLNVDYAGGMPKSSPTMMQTLMSGLSPKKVIPGMARYMLNRLSWGLIK